ncbi:MAG: phosphotransferase, partial [Pseudomonadota bacterium]
MAVYTEVTDAALEAFLTDYDVGTVTAFKGIAGGVENTNYLLDTTEGRYILTLYEKRVAEADLPFFVGLMDHLAASGFPCPRPIRRRDGAALGRLEGRAAAMVSFLDGVDVKRPTPEQCYMAGAAMARMHANGTDFSIKRTNALAPHGWPELADASRARADEVEPGLAALIDSELDALASLWPSELPSGVI